MDMEHQTELFNLYRAAQQGDWERLKNFYGENVGWLVYPLTAVRDSAFHLAVFSESNEPLQYLLNISEKNHEVKYRFLERNRYGNTPLHEAAANGNLEAVEALVGHYSKLLKEDMNANQNEDVFLAEVEKCQNKFLEDVNWKGETPLFRAAAFGRTEVVEYLASKSLETESGFLEQGERKEVKRLRSIHRKNQRIVPRATEGETFVEKPEASILHVTITGHHFDTALYLLDLDESLATVKGLNGCTSLHLLATMPLVFQSGYRWDTWIRKVLYFWRPISPRNTRALAMRNMLKDKSKRKLALKLVEKLVEKDSSWDETIAENVMIHEGPGKGVPIQAKRDYTTIPLLLATERGVVEIVNKILDKYPPLVEHENNLNQNILHVAIKHRQCKIFNLVKTMKISRARLVRKVDNKGYTILHHAADMEKEPTEIHPLGPVYQLQEEMKWYNRVNEIMPSYYADLRDRAQNMTCLELFEMKHDRLLEQAKKWIKRTSQSCSTVAALVATVVFAAAYTVPGGSNEKGYPIFHNSTLFLVFTIMDVIALVCSLTSVVMFLSILVSPYTYDDFLHNLPRKLKIGLSLLFISLITAMIAFGATILLIIRSEKPHWTTTLIHVAAFLPLSIFALTNFPMYAAFGKTSLELYRRLHKRWYVTKPTVDEPDSVPVGDDEP